LAWQPVCFFSPSSFPLSLFSLPFFLSSPPFLPPPSFPFFLLLSLSLSFLSSSFFLFPSFFFPSSPPFFSFSPFPLSFLSSLP
ncbi:hypothetical protein ACXWR7_11935, partial [Streptococcus pyogenes]